MNEQLSLRHDRWRNPPNRVLLNSGWSCKRWTIGDFAEAVDEFPADDRGLGGGDDRGAVSQADGGAR